MLQIAKAIDVITRGCIDVKVDEECYGNNSQRNDDESCFEDPEEEQVEQVQESKKEESESEDEEADPQ